MRPTVRSRLWAAGTAFVLGFVIANVGILAIAGADRWIWLGVAVVLMLTGAVGVLVADTGRRLSLWAVLGFELAVVATVLPLWWTLAVALTPADLVATSMLPQEPRWSVLGDVLGAGPLRDAAVTSILTVAKCSTFGDTPRSSGTGVVCTPGQIGSPSILSFRAGYVLPSAFAYSHTQSSGAAFL